MNTLEYRCMAYRAHELTADLDSRSAFFEAAPLLSAIALVTSGHETRSQPLSDFPFEDLVP